MIEDDEDRIRQKAYELWEADGRPEGREQRHWTEAREIVALHDSFGSTLRPVAKTVDEPVEPALAFENQGDFPGLTDLGEGPRGPSWSATRDTMTSRSADDQGNIDPPAPSARNGSSRTR